MSRHHDLYAALVCGKDLPPGDWRELLRITGLLHIAVVSGSHLVWVERWLRRLLGRSWSAGVCVFIALFIYALMTDWGAPVIRAGLSLLLSSASRRWAWAWSPVQIAFMSGLISLALYPHWIRSLSLLLSWTAALILASTPSMSGAWRVQIKIYIGLFLCFLPFGPPHPISIFCNVLLAPFLGIFIFPASVFVCLWTRLASLLDQLCDVLQTVLQWIRIFTGQGLESILFPTMFLWIYLFVLQIFFVISEIRRKRAQ